MTWWSWAAAAVEAILLTILALLWHDSLRERRGWRLRDHPRLLAASIISPPVGFVVVLLCPLWPALVLIAIPAAAIVVMALAS